MFGRIPLAVRAVAIFVVVLIIGHGDKKHLPIVGQVVVAALVTGFFVAVMLAAQRNNRPDRVDTRVLAYTQRSQSNEPVVWGLGTSLMYGTVFGIFAITAIAALPHAVTGKLAGAIAIPILAVILSAITVRVLMARVRFTKQELVVYGFVKQQRFSWDQITQVERINGGQIGGTGLFGNNSPGLAASTLRFVLQDGSTVSPMALRRIWTAKADRAEEEFNTHLRHKPPT